MSEYENNALIKAIKDDELRKRTLSLVEKILARSHMIWGFIRYPEMADHCERHTGNVFELLTRFLVYSQKHLLEGEDKLNDSELFCLILATWLHDIGGMGGGINDKEFLSPDRARKEHPFNGGRLVLDDGTLFLDLNDDEQSAIADIVVSHSSRVELNQLQPKMVSGNTIRTEVLAVLLSLADACDTQESRVGGLEEVKLKLHKLELLKNKLEEEIEKVERQPSQDEEKLAELRADVEYICAQEKHHYKHLSVKNVFFTPVSIILEKKGLTLPEYEKYFNIALSEVQKEFERVKFFLSKYNIMHGEIRAYDKNKDDMKELYRQVEQYEPIELLEEEKRHNRTTIFEYIDFFENHIRKLMSKKLEEYYGDWWREDVVYKDIKEFCEDMRNKEIDKGEPEEPLILNYADFSHYSRIITKKNNWKNIFSSCFKDKEEGDIEFEFKKLKEFRNPSHHHRTITKDIDWVRLCIIDLCIDERAKSEFEKIVRGRKKLPEEKIKEETPPSKHIIPIDESILFEVTTLNTLYELTKNGNFLEKPLKEEEWKSKREEVITFNERAIEDAISKLTTHRILLISGQPNVGKSTFLLFFLDKCLERGIKDWSTVIFLNPAIKEKDFDSVLEDVNTFIQSKDGQNNVLLAIDGLHRRESDENYVNKCLKLFEKASHSGYKIIATLRDSEKEFLKNKLENLDEWDIDEWAKLEPIMEEIKLTYKTEELKRILVNYLNLYREKIKLQNVSFDDMNMYVREAVNIPPEKIEQYQRFNECMEIVVKKSEGLAGYIAFLIEDIAEHEGEFSKEIVKKYPIGMVNIILNTIWRDYYVENDDLIPLFIIFLTKLTELDDPVNYMTRHFFDSFKMWGIEVLDKELKKEVKEKILKKIENFVNSFTIRTTFLEEDEYSLLNYWNDAIEEAIHKGKYDKGNKNYNRIVDEFKDAEKNWKYLIKDNYIPVTVNQLENRNETFFSLDRPRSDIFYLVGDIAKLWRITDPNVLDSSTAFFKEYRQKYAESLPLQFDFLKKTLSLLWRMKAQDFWEIVSYDPAIASYKEAIEIDNDDYRSYWGIGECYEGKGEKHKALDCYTESANKQGTSKGYGVLASKVSEYRKEYSKKQGISEDFELRYLESQENAATNAINCVGGEREHRNWSILGEALQRNGWILNENEKYLKAISMFEQAIMAYEEAVNVMIGLKQVPKDWYHWQIGYCHKDLAFTYNKLENLDEAKKNLKMAIDYFKLGAAREDCTKG